MIQSLKADLDKLKMRLKAIAEALEKSGWQCGKASGRKGKNLLQLSAKGLKEAAEPVKDTAPAILTKAGLKVVITPMQSDNHNIMSLAAP